MMGIILHNSYKNTNTFYQLKELVGNKMKKIIYLLLILTVITIHSCGIKTAKEVGLHFSTERSTLPDSLVWKELGFAKELINQKELLVIISGGTNPIPPAFWDKFKPSFPYKKNIDRHLLFQKTAYYRSPHTDVNCKGDECIKQREYKGYTWVELAKPICVDYVGGKTNILNPEKGHLVIKTIQKCQALMFNDSIYQLTDNKGNLFVMHATETGKPDTSAVLPKGWSLKKVILEGPLIIAPFGGGNECYYNIIGDHLGQGYHQYVFADNVYPSSK
jgi:hypothetical protein